MPNDGDNRPRYVGVTQFFESPVSIERGGAFLFGNEEMADGQPKFRALTVIHQRLLLCGTIWTGWVVYSGGTIAREPPR